MYDTQRLRGIVNGFDPAIPIEEAWMPPSAWYTEPAIFEMERSSILLPSWQPIARRAELAESGSYVSGCFLGEPWIIVNDSGELRAFSNVCRHKGREVMTGHGRADALVCGYHAWKYALDGALTSAPKTAGIKSFDKHAMSLSALSVDTFGPWVLINMDPSAPSFSEQHPEISKALVDSGIDGLSFYDTVEWTIECNWKVYADNYLDGGYHIPHMHPTLDAQLDMTSYTTKLFSRSSLQTSDAGSESDARIDYDPRARIGQGALYAYFYPNLALNRYGPCLDSNHIIPIDQNRCRVVYEFYFDREKGAEAEEFIKASIAQSAITQKEDIEICESVQRGLRSINYDRGRYAPKLEIGEHQFHRLLAADLKRVVGGL